MCYYTFKRYVNIYEYKRVRSARENILELLLLNHPLDCPIRDRAGDVQDISMVYGTDRGRFYESFKRSVPNLNICSPYIKTSMTRCIHCTRCVRSSTEICSVLIFVFLVVVYLWGLGCIFTNFFFPIY